MESAHQDKQLDDAFEAFNRPASPYPHMILGGGVAFLLFVGLGISVSASNWPLVAVFTLTLVGLAIYSWMSFDRIRGLSAICNIKHLDWHPALPDIQRENLNLEVIELARIMDVDLDQISDIQSAYIVAQDLAFRQIQHEESSPLLRNVSVGDVPFDGVMINGNELVCCDVSFLVSPEINQEKVDALFRRIATVKQNIESKHSGFKVKLMLILITQLNSEDDDYLRRTLDSKHFKAMPLDRMDIRLLDFEALQRVYVTS